MTPVNVDEPMASMVARPLSGGGLQSMQIVDAALRVARGVKIARLSFS